MSEPDKIDGRVIPATQRMLEYQLRRFQIMPGRMDDFVERWKAGVVPLGREAGFETHGAWAAGDEFVWVLSFDGNFLSADTAYYASAAHRQMKPDPAELIESSDERMVERVI